MNKKEQKMIDYSKTKIYKIFSHLGDKIYIGSTTKDYLSQRLGKHRSGYRQWIKNKEKFMTSYTIFEEYGVENCLIELLEAKACNSIDERKKLEGKHIRENVCVNKFIAGRTTKEYEEDRKEKKKEYMKGYKQVYNKKNRERINEYTREYRRIKKLQKGSTTILSTSA